MNYWTPTEGPDGSFGLFWHSPVASFASLGAAPDPAEFGPGPVWIGGVPYWCTGAAYVRVRKGVSKLFSEQDVLFLGDSRMKAGSQNWLFGATGSGTSGIEVLGFEDPTQVLYGSLTAGTGSLDYNGTTKQVRWRAPADTANGYGPWTSVRPLEQVWLESFTPNNRLLVSGRRAAAWTTRTDSVTVSANSNLVLYPKFRTTLPAIFGMDQYNCAWLATGGELLESVSEALDWAVDAYPGRRCWIVWAGVNNINTGGAYIASGVTAVQQIVDKADQAGATVLFLGNHAEWGAAVGTALTAQNIADFKTIETAIVNAAMTNPHVHYCDVFGVSMDRSDTANSFKPFVSPTKLLLDTVHPTSYGGQLFAEKMTADLGRLFADKRVPPYFDGNGMAHGMFNTGTTGSAGTGASGTVPTGWSVARTSGADVAAACSIVDNPYGVGKALKLDITSTAEGIITVSNNNAALQTIAALGKSAGQQFRMCYEIADLTAGINFVLGYGRQYSSGPTNLGVNYQVWASLNDQGTQSQNRIRAFTGRRRYYAPWRKMESSCTHLYAFVEIAVPASYTGSLLLTFVGIY